MKIIQITCNAAIKAILLTFVAQYNNKNLILILLGIIIALLSEIDNFD